MTGIAGILKHVELSMGDETADGLRRRTALARLTGRTWVVEESDAAGIIDTRSPTLSSAPRTGRARQLQPLGSPLHADGEGHSFARRAPR